MTLLEQLQENKGTVSSALGKELAKKALSGDRSILDGSMQLIHFDDKNVRSGAAKILEKVAEEKPEWVSDHLSELLTCMNYPEAQTRWMVLHICGLCAQLNPDVAREVFEEAIKYLDKKHGTVLNDRAITYLGYIGSLSEHDCKQAFPHLIQSFQLHPNRITRIFESLWRLADNLDEAQKQLVRQYIHQFENDKPAIKTWARKVNKKIG
jgi:tetratricopeptide (TPR) repeat protein